MVKITTCGLTTFGIMLAAAAPPPHFSSDVPLVLVDVQVTERGTGRVIELLSPSDFEIYDNGELREVKEFQIETPPLDVVFLTYGKTGLGPIKDIREFHKSLDAAAKALRNGDRGAVLRTDSEHKVDLHMTDDLEKVRHALVRGDKYRTGRDSLFDALKIAAGLLPRPKEASRRRAIIAITDDVERGSRTTMSQLITELLEADATLHAVVVALGRQARREVGFGGVWGIPRVSREFGGGPRQGDSIRAAVEATGGDAISGDMLQARFPELIHRMRLRYLLGFYAPTTSRKEYRTIEIRLSPEAKGQYPNAVIRARRGYYTGPKGAD